MKIGVFDSGVGGLSVAQAIEKALPEHEVVFVNDAQHVPYGKRLPEEIFGFVVPILQGLVDEGCEIIVIACNTVTTTLIDQLREKFTVPLVAVEPMVKPAAAQTKTRVIAVCATPAALKSPRYAELKQMYASDVRVIEPDCSDWAEMIEHQAVDEHKIQKRIDEVLAKQADIIVLACTHYHWIEDLIKRIAIGRAEVIQPEQAIIRQLKRVIAEHSPRP